jgi:hypothetical protein
MSELVVEEVYPVSFAEGVMVVGFVRGTINEGDEIRLVRFEGVERTGSIGRFHIHHTHRDPPGRVRVSVTGEVATFVQPGDVLVAVGPEAEVKDGPSPA